ncbi:twin-arginine translocation signal domain-containing protein [Rubneribacter badeniensis]
MSGSLTRRSFVKWGAATAGAAALVGFTGCAPQWDKS